MDIFGNAAQNMPKGIMAMESLHLAFLTD